MIRQRQKMQECYDDAMNAADEHGIIHPGKCPHPITGPKTAADGNGTTEDDDAVPGAPTSPAPGDDSSLQSKQQTPSVAQSEPTVSGVENEGAATNGKQGTVAGSGGTLGPSASAEVIRPILLGVLQELCELARPEIAAAAVVAGVCKVGLTRRLTRSGHTELAVQPCKWMCCRAHRSPYL